MIPRATERQCRYINYVCAQLQYADFTPVTPKSIDIREAASWIQDLEKEFEEHQIESEVFGIGQS